MLILFLSGKNYITHDLGLGIYYEEDYLDRWANIHVIAKPTNISPIISMSTKGHSKRKTNQNHIMTIISFNFKLSVCG